jgi:hypothetical protein
MERVGVTSVSCSPLRLHTNYGSVLSRRQQPSARREPSTSGIRFEMSKRLRPGSPSNSPAKTTRISESTRPFICQLPPTCNNHPTTLGSASEMESHYSTCHAHVCSAEGCHRIFPEPRFLDLVCSSSSILALYPQSLTLTSTKQSATILLRKSRKTEGNVS